jgi:hypothetical protein
MNRSGIIILGLAIYSSTILSGCEKINLEPVTELKVRLTDAPINAQEVNIDIKEVKVNYAKDTGWTTLNTNTGIYNLLKYQNGQDTLIAKGNVRATNIIQQLRLVLGERNSIKINNEVYPLSTSSGVEKGIQITIDRKMNRNIETIIIDFDANLSVTETAKGLYQLKPFLRLK